MRSKEQAKITANRSSCRVRFTMMRAEKEVFMKNTYVSPVVEVSVLNTEDVVMISGLDIKDNGTLVETSWDDLG